MSSVAITDNLAIRGAMKVAGINMPTNQRMIWEWIRDHPGQSCGSIQEGVKLKEGSVSAQLSQMIDRKMIDGKLAHSMRAKREIYHYTVVGKEYQTRPMSPGEKSRKIRNNEARGIKTIIPALAVVEVVDCVDIEKQAKAILINTSVVLARELLDQLLALFADPRARA